MRERVWHGTGARECEGVWEGVGAWEGAIAYVDRSPEEAGARKGARALDGKRSLRVGGGSSTEVWDGAWV